MTKYKKAVADEQHRQFERYEDYFKLIKLSDEGHKLLSFDEWMQSPKQKNSIMPANLPKYSKAQHAGLNQFLEALKARNMIRAIFHYKNEQVWLYMNGQAYDSHGAINVCLKEYKTMVSCLGHHLLRGHDCHPLAFGRRKGKATIEIIPERKIEEKSLVKRVLSVFGK